MSGDKMGGPALPITTSSHIHENGMTLREYAAIHLKVPNSGNAELDAMIEKSLWHDYAAHAITSFSGIVMECDWTDDKWAASAKDLAYAMLAERAKRGGS